MSDFIAKGKRINVLCDFVAEVKETRGTKSEYTEQRGFITYSFDGHLNRNIHKAVEHLLNPAKSGRYLNDGNFGFQGKAYSSFVELVLDFPSNFRIFDNNGDKVSAPALEEFHAVHIRLPKEEERDNRVYNRIKAVREDVKNTVKKEVHEVREAVDKKIN